MAAHGIKKINSSHATFIDAALPVLRRADVTPEITKASLGIIKSVNAGAHRIKIDDIAAGFKLTIRGACNVQEVFVYCDADTDRRQIIKDDLEATFNQAFSVVTKKKGKVAKTRIQNGNSQDAVTSKPAVKHSKDANAQSKIAKQTWEEASRSPWEALRKLLDSPPE